MGAMTAVAGAIVVGAIISSRAASKAGKAQAKAATTQLAFQEQAYAKSEARMNQFMHQAAQFSKPTVSDLRAMEQIVKTSEAQYQFAQQNLAQAETVLNAVNPAIAAAGESAYKLIRGEQAAVLKPLQDSRARQKTKLEEQLAGRFGPGFRFSASGIKALNDFDNQSSVLLADAQMGAINTVVNAANGLSGVANAAQGRGIAGIQASQAASLTSIQAQSELSRRALQPYQIAASFQPNANGVAAAGANLTSVIGNQYAGQIGLGNSISNAGAAYGQSMVMKDIAASGNGNYTGQTNPNYLPTPTPQYQQLPGSPVFNTGDLAK